MIRFISDNRCGNVCTEGENCAGFAYNRENGTCYLSKTQIYGPPSNSKYSDKYSKLDRRCNKINMLSDTKLVNELSLTENSIYACYDGEVGTPVRVQFANNGNTILDELERTNVPDQTTYKIQPIEWDTEITTLDINAPTKAPDQNIGDVTFIESKEEHLGQYMTPYKCVSDIPLYKCLRACEESTDCVGVEHNPIYTDDRGEIHYNMCCPKRSIDRKVKRRQEFVQGSFYTKEKSNIKNAVRIIQ